MTWSGTQQPSVSVIIVTYNSAATIKKCLESVISGYQSAEIIVVDNKSEGKTLDIRHCV